MLSSERLALAGLHSWQLLVFSEVVEEPQCLLSGVANVLQALLPNSLSHHTNTKIHVERIQSETETYLEIFFVLSQI